MLLRLDGRLQPIPSEGGHIGFAPSSAFEQKVLEQAAAQFERVSWERILSGPGLELIDAVSRRELDGPAEPRNAATNHRCRLGLEIIIFILKNQSASYY